MELNECACDITENDDMEILNLQLSGLAHKYKEVSQIGKCI